LPDHAARHVVLEVGDSGDDYVQIRLTPETALEVALRIAAAVAALMKLTP
jgi:hypothetical protein